MIIARSESGDNNKWPLWPGLYMITQNNTIVSSFARKLLITKNYRRLPYDILKFI